MDELAPFLKYTKPVIRYNLRDFDSFVRWAGNVVHQNYHPDGCGWQECMKPFCRECRKALDRMHREHTDATGEPSPDLLATATLLTQALDALSRVPCPFKMCDGWTKPSQDMITCCRCRAIRDILLSRLAPRPSWAKGIRLRWPGPES